MTNPLHPGNGNELRDLLAPLGLEEFLADYWGQKPLFRRGEPGRYEHLFSVQEYDATLDRHVPGGPEFNVYSSYDKAARPGHFPPSVRIDPRDFRDVLAGEASVRLQRFENAHRGIARFTQALKAQLGFPGKVTVNSMRSPEGCGFPMHFDQGIVASLQIRGAKTWRYSPRPCLDWPPSNGQYLRDGDVGWLGPVASGTDLRPRKFADHEFLESTLEPGDLLVLPAGVWHAASAAGESLALNVAFVRTPFSQLVSTLISSHLGLPPAWDSTPPLPLGPAAPAARRAALAYLTERLAELTERLQGLQADSAALASTVAALVLHPNGEAPLDPGEFAAVAAPLAPLARGDELRVPVGMELYLAFVSGGEDLVLFGNQQEITLDPSAAPFLHRLLTRRRFVAEEAIHWTETGQPVPWASVAPGLDLLLAQGFLERVPR